MLSEVVGQRDAAASKILNLGELLLGDPGRWVLELRGFRVKGLGFDVNPLNPKPEVKEH